MKVSLVLMLSGKGERFGENKLLAKFQGEPLFQIAFGQAAGSGADHVTVVTGYEKIISFCKNHYPQMSIVKNLYPKRGISESLKLGLKEEMGRCAGRERSILMGGDFCEKRHMREIYPDIPDGCCFLVGDQPLLKAATLRKMFSAFRKAPDRIYLLSDGKHEGNPAIFPCTYYPGLLSLKGDSGGKRIADRYPEKIARIMAEDVFEMKDIDTREDLHRLKTIS